jgi:hypothetical protein
MRVLAKHHLEEAAERLVGARLVERFFIASGVSRREAIHFRSGRPPCSQEKGFSTRGCRRRHREDVISLLARSYRNIAR